MIDDTGSMGDEIAAVKSALSNFIGEQTSDPNSPDIEWSLITFKDDVTVRGTTTSPTEIQALVNSLYASGGGDCPEESLGALGKAASLLGRGEEDKQIVLATDASPQGGARDVSSAISVLQGEGIKVHTLLTGDCVYSTATASVAPTTAKGTAILSAREAFSHISEETGGLYFYLPGAGVDTLSAALKQAFDQAVGGGDSQNSELTLEVSPRVLGRVNHELVEIAPILGARDALGANPNVELVSVTSNEPEDGQGDGATAGDVLVTEDGRIFLRAERSGSNSGRAYTLTYQATNANGKKATASADVLVPHDASQ